MDDHPRPFRARANGLTLTGVEAGPADGPPVLLLHGFPEFSFGWRHQLPALARAGFRAVAPNLRGYDTSDKPTRVRDYRVEELAADVAGLADHLGGRAAVVGHDWGGIVAWFAAMRHPGRVSRLAVLNAPHPLAYLRELRRSSQLVRSWYAGFFQVPWLPERLIRANDYALARGTFRAGPCRNAARPAEDVETYVQALARPGALTASLNYYRAAFRRRSSDIRRLVRPVEVPTLLIWGERDRYLVPGLADELDAWVPRLRVERLPAATHWVQHDEPERVNELLVGFLSKPT
ncbi:MAG: alpha/beta hydrolase [Phycisphaerales bacterium]|nr:alpha/beta hydrolase [Phycisphaerales bacterium]